MTKPSRRSFPVLEAEQDDRELAEIIERGNAVLASPGLEDMWQQLLDSPAFRQLERDLDALSAVFARAAERGPDDDAQRDHDRETLASIAARFSEPMVVSLEVTDSDETEGG